MDIPFRLNDSSGTSELPKIGPGLGSRSTFWAKVRNRIIHENKRVADPIENDMLIALASDKRWLNMVPPEWIEIYGALYDESKYFIISESERTKIDKDIGRTFSLFERNARLLRLQFKVNMTGYSLALQNVLMAASHERGYCQGINFVAAVFLLYQASEKEAFTLLCYLLKQRFMEILYNPKCSSLLEYMNYFEKRLRKHNKRIYKYFKHIDYSPVCYSIEWFTTCFIVTCPGELSSCVLDLILVGFDDIMIRVGLAMLDHLEEQLLKLDLETMQLEFKPLASKADPYDVMFRALTIPVPANSRTNVLKTMALNIEVMNPRQEFVNTLRVAKAEEDEDVGPTPVKPAKMVGKNRIVKKKKSIKKKTKDKGRDAKLERVRGDADKGDESPVTPPPTAESALFSHSTDECADDESLHAGRRPPGHPVHSGGHPAAGTVSRQYRSPSKVPQPPRESISPVTPLTKDSKSFAPTPSNNRKPLLQVLTNPRQAIRNEIQAFQRHRKAVAAAKTESVAAADHPPSPLPSSPVPKTSTRLRKQSRPETRFSRQFLKRIPSGVKSSSHYLPPHIAAELVEFDDLFRVNKEYHRPLRRTTGIGTTPTNGSSVGGGGSTAASSASVTPATSAKHNAPSPASEPSLFKAQVSTRRVNNPRMLQDPLSPLNVELHEKMEARLMHHLFPPAPLKKGSAGSGGTSPAAPTGNTGGGAKSVGIAAGPQGGKGPPPTKNVSTGQYSNASSAPVSPQKSVQQQPPPQPPQQQSGAVWFDKMVQDTLWFTTFGLVHAPVPPQPPKPAPTTAAAAPTAASSTNGSSSRAVKESNDPPWVTKKEMQQQPPQRQQQQQQPGRGRPHPVQEEEVEALVWIPGTQEGYDGDVSQDDSEGEEVMQPGTGQPQSRTKRRANHVRATSVGNRNKMVSVDVQGRSNIVEDLENPINLLANVEERWFSVASEGNPSFKLLNKQYHNLTNLALRRKRNKKRSFKEKV